MAQKDRSSGCETNKRTSSIRNPSKTSLLEMHEASYSVHRKRRCEEEQNFITWLPERESEWKVRRELCKFGGVWEGGGRFMIHPFYLCIIRAMKLIFDSTCSDFALGVLVFKMSRCCDQVWLTWIWCVSCPSVVFHAYWHFLQFENNYTFPTYEG